MTKRRGGILLLVTETFWALTWQGHSNGFQISLWGFFLSFFGQTLPCDWKNCTVFCGTEVISRSGYLEHSGIGRGPSLGLKCSGTDRAPSLGLQNYYFQRGAVMPCYAARAKQSASKVRETGGTMSSPRNNVLPRTRQKGGTWRAGRSWSCMDIMPLIWLPYFSNTWEQRVILAFLSVLIFDWKKNNPQISIHHHHYYPERTEGRLRNEWQGYVSLASAKLCTLYEITSSMTA